MKYLLILLYSTFYGQVLQRQTIAAQGGSVKTKNGIVVTQSVGQQSTIGNYNYPNLRLGQGFQQSKTAAKKNTEIESISTFFSPNPFDTQITFTFSKEIKNPIKVLISDLSGKVIYNTQQNGNQNKLLLDNLNFSSGVYLVQLTAHNFNFTAKILKNK